MFNVIEEVSKNRYERVALNTEIASRPERYDNSEIRGVVISEGDSIEARVMTSNHADSTRF